MTSRQVDIGAYLRRLREAAGLSVDEIARDLGRSRLWLKRLEAGDPNLTIAALAGVARVLGMEMPVSFRPMITVHSPDEIPPNISECEEDAFWDSHDMGDEFFESVEPDPAEDARLARIREARAQRKTRS